MSLKASSSGKNLILPVSDSPRDLERERLVGDDNDEKLFRGSAMTRRGAYAAISYMACAVLLVMFNKAALSSYKFPSANVITLFQMICSCGFLYALRRWKMISFTVGESLTISDDNITTLVPLKTLKKTLPLAGAYLLYMLASMESVRGVNVPMYTTLRRTTVVFTMVMEYILAGQRYTSPIVRSVGLIVLGAFIAGARDLSFDAYGYAVVFLSNITTAGNPVALIALALCGVMHFTSSFAVVGISWIHSTDVNRPSCLALFLYTGILLELQHIPEHNSKFSAHTDNLRQLEVTFSTNGWFSPPKMISCCCLVSATNFDFLIMGLLEVRCDTVNTEDFRAADKTQNWKLGLLLL
ncbi:Nucleotide/sugar transporter family protein, partial [Prunus dulcis]